MLPRCRESSSAGVRPECLYRRYLGRWPRRWRAQPSIYAPYEFMKPLNRKVSFVYNLLKISIRSWWSNPRPDQNPKLHHGVEYVDRTNILHVHVDSVHAIFRSDPRVIVRKSVDILKL